MAIVYSRYYDRKGEKIAYGDILRCLEFKDIDFEKPHAVKMPSFMLCKVDGKTMMYCTTADEYVDIEDCKLQTDKLNELCGFEIFMHREIYDSINKDTDND